MVQRRTQYANIRREMDYTTQAPDDERRLQCERTTGPLRPPLFQRGFLVTVPAAKMTRHSVSLGAARQPLFQQQEINTHSSRNQPMRASSFTKLCSHKSGKQLRGTRAVANLNGRQKYGQDAVQPLTFLHMKTQLLFCPRPSTQLYSAKRNFCHFKLSSINSWVKNSEGEKRKTKFNKGTIGP